MATLADEKIYYNGNTDISIQKSFIEITIPLSRPINVEERKIIEYIKNEFKDNGFYFEMTKENLIFYLKTLNFEKFKKFIFSLLEDLDKESEVDKEIFLKIINKIGQIKSYGIKGGKRIYLDYNKERKITGRSTKIENRGGYYYAQSKLFSKENNELPQEFENKIICEDSERIIKNLPSNCIDLIITSPPYNFGLGYDTSEDGTDWEKYFEKLFSIFNECVRVTKYGGRIIINIQPLFSDYIPSHHIISDFFRGKGLIWKGEILWEKNNYNCKYCAWGSWKSPSSPYLKYTWEFLEIFAKGDLKKTGLKENIDITEDEFKKWVVARWSISPERKMEKYGHPAMFPEELVERALKLFSYEGDIILDPFNGVGTTSVVAKKWNRRFIGIDISEKYCKIAKKRIKEILSINQ